MKNTSFLLVRLCGAILLASAGSACSGGSKAAVPVPLPHTDLLQQLKAEIGSAACDSSQQCKTIAVGHKACGGPATYFAWSSKANDGARIKLLADAYSASRKAEEKKSGMVSTCSAVMDPGASCNAGRCVSGGAEAAI